MTEQETEPPSHAEEQLDKFIERRMKEWDNTHTVLSSEQKDNSRLETPNKKQNYPSGKTKALIRKEWELKNQDKIKAYRRTSYLKNKQKRNEYARAHKDKTKASHHKYYLKHKAKINQHNREYYYLHMQENRARGNAYYHAHKQQVLAYRRAYYQKYKEVILNRLHKKRKLAKCQS